MKKTAIGWIGLLALLVMSGPAWADLSTGLGAYYPFDGNAQDASGNGHHGTAKGGVTFVAGKKGQAASFNGVSSYIETTYMPKYTQTDPFTLSVWVKCGPQARSEAHVLGIKFPGGAQLFSLTLKRNPDGGSHVEFGIRGDKGTSVFAKSTLVGKSVVTDEMWHHIVVLRDVTARTFSLYVDCNLEDAMNDGTQGVINETFAMALAIGGRNHYLDGIEGYYQGAVDDLRFYDRTLAAAEISELCESTIPAACIPQYQQGYAVGYQTGCADCKVTGACGSATFDISNGVLHVPCLDLGTGTTYWLDLKLTESGLVLQNWGENR